MWSFFSKHSVMVSGVAIILLVVAIIAGRQAVKLAPIDAGSDKKVTLVDVSTFRTGGGVISANGTIESSAQADLRSQLSAPVTGVNVSIGDWVSTGQSLLTLQNSDLLAQLDQANANVALTKAQYSNAGVSVDSATQNALDKILDAYNKSDDAIRTQADQFFSNSASNNPQLSFSIPNQQLLTNIQFDRLSLEQTLLSWKAALSGLSTSTDDKSLDAAIALSKKNLESTSSFLDEASRALNIAVTTSPAIVAGLPNWKLAISAARSSVSGAIAALTGAESSLAGARAVVKNTDGTDSSVSSPSSAQAQILSAEAAVQSLKVQLAKTIIRAPFAGRVGNLPVKVGELVSPGEVVASVVNPQSLQVKVYVSESDYSKIKYGSAVTLDGGATGVVTNVAPSIDLVTKKVEIKIVINNQKGASLVIGQNVHVEIKGNAPAKGTITYLVPIQDIKIVQGGASVYTLDGESRVKNNPIVLGEVSGDFVSVISGLDDSMRIISPVYELEEGDKVIAQ